MLSIIRVKAVLIAIRRTIGDLASTVLMCALISSVGWWPLCLAPAFFAHVIARVSSWSSHPGTLAGFLFTWKAVLSPLIFAVVMFLFKRRIARILGPLIAKALPAEWVFIAAPAIATMMFTMSWSYTHLRRWNEWGFLPEICFPATIGLFSFVTLQCGGALRGRLRGFLELRDAVPRFGRLMVSVFLPTVLSLVLVKRVHDRALAGQLLVVLSVVISYLLTLPRQRPFVRGVQVLSKESLQ